MSKHVVSLGDIVLDLITPVTLPITPFNHQETKGAHLQPGGSANFMIAGSRIGLRISAVGTVGDDMFGKALLDSLHEEDIATEGIPIAPGSHSALVLDLIDSKTREHVFVGNLSEGPYIDYSPEIDAIITSADTLFLQGYTLLENQLSRLVPAALQRANEKGIPVYFDVGPTARHSPFELVRKTIEHSNALLMTEDELPLSANGLNGEEAYRFLLSLGPDLLVIKQGGKGCSLVRKEGVEAVPGYPVTVVDTVGAGDCFDAAFIYGRVNGFELRQCAQLANAMGAASVQKVGAGRNVPTCAEVQTILDQFQVNISLSC